TTPFPTGRRCATISSASAGRRPPHLSQPPRGRTEVPMTVTLRHGALTAQATPQGGELISLTGPDGTEYIWSGDPAYWAGRNPILFPIVGSLKDNTVYFDTKPHHMG